MTGKVQSALELDFGSIFVAEEVMSTYGGVEAQLQPYFVPKYMEVSGQVHTLAT
jgi:hypothetical protein